MLIRQKPAAALVLILALVMLALVAGCGKPAVDNPKPNKLAVNVMDVGQGDAVLIRTPEQITLIDTGDMPARDKLVAYLKGQGISAIDNLIITHPHADHIGGAVIILEHFTVKHVYDSGQPTTTSLYRNYLSLIQKKKIPFSVLTAGGQIDIGNGGLLKVFFPDTPFISGSESDLNNNSIVIRLVYGDFSMLLTGDAEQEAEGRMLKKFAGELKSQVLKSGHHGSRSSSSLPFLEVVKPEVAIISDGVNNDYHHPHPSTLKKYDKLKIKVYRTDTDGTVTVDSDGKTYNITNEKN